MGGRQRWKKRQAAKQMPPQPPAPAAPTPSRSWWKLWRKRIIAFLAVLGTLVTIVVSIPQLRNMFTSSKQLVHEEKFEEGNLVSPKLPDPQYTILEKRPEIINYAANDSFPPLKGVHIPGFNRSQFVMVQVGQNVFNFFREDMEAGIRLGRSPISGCDYSNISFVVKNERLYVSLKFWDLRSEDLIGDIQFNHWKICKGTYFDCNYDDRHFEVTDKQGNIVVSVEFGFANMIHISGYFVQPGDSTALVVRNDMIKATEKWDCIPKSDPKWKERVAREAANCITKVFHTRPR
jgi:hypothetical protein